MRHRAHWPRLITLCSLALLATTVGPADAQKTTLPPSVVGIRRDQAGWSMQLRLAREIGQKVLVGLKNAPVDEGTPIDEGLVQAARDTYVLIRAARYGMVEAVRNDKSQDPILQLTVKRVEQAWTLSGTPVAKASSGMPRQEYLEIAVRDLDQSMRLVDQILIILP